MSDNMRIYNAVRTTPAEAKKTIKGGRLSGFTDINPQYRIERLTEQFGPCGIGWYYETNQKWTERVGDEVLCFVDISLYIKADGEWSKPIQGTGGSMIASKERNGLYASDEGYKMATTDALSVACKMIGIGADVYWQKGESNYSLPTPQEEPKQDAPKQDNQSRTERIKAVCEHHKISMKTFGEMYKSLQESGSIPQVASANLEEDDFNTMISLVHKGLERKSA